MGTSIAGVKGQARWVGLLLRRPLVKLPLRLTPLTYFHVGDAATGNSRLVYAPWVQDANPRINRDALDISCHGTNRAHT